ncbi:MAG: adenylyltransferase/cytidyltransferase family protein [Parcubacteria group bacterium]|jgi:cytidyltransferase-like protein
MRTEKIAPVISLKKFLDMSFKGKKVVLMGGAFDIIHAGHIDQINQAKKLGDILVVHITGDKRFAEKKKRRPVFSAKERANTIASIKGVDYVFIYDGRHYDQKILDIIRPAIIFSHDESYDKTAKEHFAKGLRHSNKIVIIHSKKLNSSSDILRKILRKPLLYKP